MPVHAKPFLLICLATLSLFAGSAAAGDPASRAPWWHHYPVYIGDVGAGSCNETTVLDLHAAMVSGNYGADPAWGPFGQAASFQQTASRFETIHSEGVRWITWMEAFGDCMLYAAQFDRREDGTFRVRRGDPPMAAFARMAWNWESDRARSGNAYRWVGLHNSVNDEDFAKPGFTRESFGFPVPHYPDGREAIGYLPQGQYPLNACVYDAVCVKDINGRSTIELEMLPERANRIDPKTGEREGPTDGLYRATVDRNRARYVRGHKVGDDVFAAIVLSGKDPAAPFWTDYARVMARQLIDRGVDGLWCDNCSSFNNFGMPPIRNGFGEWSESRFRLKLADWFSQAERTSLGIDSLEAFDIKAYLKRKAIEFGAKDSTYYWDPAWRDSRWQDEPVWNAYKVFKQQVGQEALRAFYEAIKAEARAAGREDFLISGNDMPVYALGWARDQWLDMVSSEQTPGWFVTTGSRGIMLPPQGKYAVVYRAGLEHQKGPYATVWYYLKGPQEKYRNRPTLSKVLFAEGFANATFLKYGGNPAHPGTPESVAWWNEFVRTNEDRIGRRKIVADVGLYFSPNNQLAFVVPGSHALDHDRQPHSFGHWGFGTALIDGHVPYRVVTDWKLSSETLADYKTFVVPGAECLDDGEVDVLESWVRAGGRLVVTGPCGVRHSVSGRFARREQAALLRWFPDAAVRIPRGADSSSPAEAAAAGGDPTIPLAKVGSTRPAVAIEAEEMSSADTAESVTFDVGLGKGHIVWASAPVGMDYYLHEAERGQLLPELLDLVGLCEQFDAGNLPTTVGAYVWQSLDENALYVDLVNYDLDLEADRINPAANLSFRLRVADDWTGVNGETITPDETAPATGDLAKGWVTIHVPRLVHYACIKIARSGSVSDGF